MCPNQIEGLKQIWIEGSRKCSGHVGVNATVKEKIRVGLETVDCGSSDNSTHGPGQGFFVGVKSVYEKRSRVGLDFG